MRIRIGDKLEVWTQEAASPVGAWRGGQVTWGNGHSYTVRWDDCGEESGRILRKLVRPRPPAAPVPRDLEVGDMVEVFDDDDSLWKCAEVQGCAAVDDDLQFDVKIVGAAKVLTVPPRRLRIRQVLRDDDVWIAVHKDNQIAVPGAMPFRANGGRIGMGVGRGKGGYKPMELKPGFTPLLQKRTFGMLGSNTIANGKRFKEGNTKMFSAKEEPRPRHEVEVIAPNVCLNKQDDMSSEDCDIVRMGSDSVDDHRQQQHNEYKEEEDDDDDDSDSVSSSDNSSSDSDSGSDSDSRTRSIEALEDHATAPAIKPFDDQKADQLQPSKKQHFVDIAESREKEHCKDIAESLEIEREPLRDQMATVPEHIHRLEMEAYTALMKAFYVCGKKLSWERVGLLTDLRGQLHISNDEHMQVLNVIMKRKGRFGGPPNF